MTPSSFRTTITEQLSNGHNILRVCAEIKSHIFVARRMPDKARKHRNMDIFQASATKSGVMHSPLFPDCQNDIRHRLLYLENHSPVILLLSSLVLSPRRIVTRSCKLSFYVLTILLVLSTLLTPLHSPSVVSSTFMN